MITRRRHTNTSLESNLISGSPQGYNPSSPKSHLSPPRAGQSSPETSCRDRTNEFLSAVKSMQSRRLNGGSYQQIRSRPQRSEFTLRARSVGKDLAKTFEKLEKLTMLAKQSSQFYDRQSEIHELTYIIKQDITSLNKQIGVLQEMARMQRYHQGKHQQTHSNSVVLALQSKLATMSNSFKCVLEVRTENLKQQKCHTDQYSHSTATTNNTMLIEEQRGDLVINMDSNDVQNKQGQAHMTDQRNSFLEEREETMQNINTTIVELGTVFQRLATMVKEQEDLVHRIDSNVEDAELNVELAHTELLKFFRNVTSNRWLMVKILVVLVMFFVFFVKFIL